MRSIIFILTMMLLAGIAGAVDYEILPGDTLSIEKINLGSPGTVAVKINIINSVDLAAMTIPLQLVGEGATIDSLSFAGSRIDYIRMKPVTIFDDHKRILFGMICMMEEHLPPGQGLMATLHLTVSDSLKDHSIAIDTTTIKPASLLFVRGNTTGYIPNFCAGKISNPRAVEATKNGSDAR